MWKGCAVTLCGDIQKLPGHDPGQPALGDPVRTGALDKMTPTGPFQPQLFFVIL